MNKLIAIASAASLAALTSGAHAGGSALGSNQFALTLQGSVTQFCAIPNPAGAYTKTISNFATNGNINANSGSHTFNISENGGCQVTWAASHGFLQGTNGNQQTVAYCASVAEGNSNACNGNATGGTMTVGASGAGTPGTKAVTFAWSIASQTGPYAVDTYADVITITVTTY